MISLCTYSWYWNLLSCETDLGVDFGSWKRDISRCDKANRIFWGICWPKLVRFIDSVFGIGESCGGAWR